MSQQLSIQVFEPDADPTQVDALTQYLREELLQLDVDRVSQIPAGPAPPGSKGVELAAIGALLITLKDSVDIAEKVVAAVRSWLGRSSSPGREVTLTLNGNTIVLKQATDEQQQVLVDQFVQAIAGAQPAEGTEPTEPV